MAAGIPVISDYRNPPTGHVHPRCPYVMKSPEDSPFFQIDPDHSVACHLIRIMVATENGVVTTSVSFNFHKRTPIRPKPT